MAAAFLLLSLWQARAVAGPGAPHPVHVTAGTAAAPFGWAAVVADFDRDGWPDAAVADRNGQHGSRYRLTIETARGQTQSVDFVSTLRAFHVVASDVDGDRDLDLLALTPLDADPVALWLNDGSGHFASAPASTAEALPSVDVRGLHVDLTHGTATVVLPTGTPFGDSVAGWCLADNGDRTRPCRSPMGRLRATDTSLFPPRAPPASRPLSTND